MKKLLGRLFDLFNESSASPLLGLMSPNTKRKGYISRVTFNHGVRPLLRLVSTLPTADVYRILANYIRSIITATQLQDKSLTIVDPTTFRGLMLTFPSVTQRVQERFGKEYTQEQFFSVISPMVERLSPSKIAKTGNSPRAFSQVLEEALKPKFSL